MAEGSPAEPRRLRRTCQACASCRPDIKYDETARPRSGGPNDWVVRSEAPALIFLIALNDVAVPDRCRAVRLALEVPVDSVVEDAHAAAVLECLHVSADDVAQYSVSAVVV